MCGAIEVSADSRMKFMESFVVAATGPGEEYWCQERQTTI